MAGFESVPINAALKFSLVCTSGGAEIRMPLQSWFGQEGGVVHGGIITAIADTAAVYSILPDLDGSSQSMTSIDLKINFLRPARLEGEALVATSRLIKKGRTVAVSAVEVRQGESHVATGLFTYLILDNAETR
jgi:uncharacterized protein (TIGR00369 family)